GPGSGASPGCTAEWPMPGRTACTRCRERMVDENQAIVTETLNVPGMVRNRRLARAIADAGWGKLRRQIACKAQWAQRTRLEVDRWFPSTRRCSASARA
ncbi:MAG: transposase, partial [Rhodospirillaceae bacterium]|nr:transposase [Rhodospirillaceae bacterium]